MLKFKPFQREDLARAAMHDGAIIGWEPGLGKTFGAFAWPLIKQATRCLQVVPGGLHRQYHETRDRSDPRDDDHAESRYARQSDRVLPG